MVAAAADIGHVCGHVADELMVLSTTTDHYCRRRAVLAAAAAVDGGNCLIV